MRHTRFPVCSASNFKLQTRVPTPLTSVLHSCQRTTRVPVLKFLLITLNL